MFDVASNQVLSFAAHDEPIRCISAVDSNVVAPGSWDQVLPCGIFPTVNCAHALSSAYQSVKLWDLRAPKAALTIQLPERVFGALAFKATFHFSAHILIAAMDVTAPLMVVGTAERHVEIYDLRQLLVHVEHEAHLLTLSIHRQSYNPDEGCYISPQVSDKDDWVFPRLDWLGGSLLLVAAHSGD